MEGPEAAWLLAAQIGCQFRSPQRHLARKRVDVRPGPLVCIGDPDCACAGEGIPPVSFFDGAEHVEGVPLECKPGRFMFRDKGVVAEAYFGQSEVEVSRGAVGELRSASGRAGTMREGAHASDSGMERIGRFVEAMVQRSRAIWRSPVAGSSCRR